MSKYGLKSGNRKKCSKEVGNCFQHVLTLESLH